MNIYLFLTLLAISFFSLANPSTSTQCGVNCVVANSNNYCNTNCTPGAIFTCSCSDNFPFCGCYTTYGGGYDVLSYDMTFQYGINNSFSTNEMIESIRANFTSLAISYGASCTTSRVNLGTNWFQSNSNPENALQEVKYENRWVPVGSKLNRGGITCLSKDKNGWASADIICNSQLLVLCYCDQNNFPFCKCLGGSPTDKTINHYIYQLRYAINSPIRRCEVLDSIVANASAIANDYGGDCKVGSSFC